MLFVHNSLIWRCDRWQTVRQTSAQAFVRKGLFLQITDQTVYKQQEHMKGYGVQIVLKTVTCLIRTMWRCSVPFHNGMIEKEFKLWSWSSPICLKRSLQSSAPSLPFIASALMTPTWTSWLHKEGAFSSDLFCHEWAWITVTLLLLLWFQFIYCKQ